MPQGRLQALWTLEGLAALPPPRAEDGPYGSRLGSPQERPAAGRTVSRQRCRASIGRAALCRGSGRQRSSCRRLTRWGMARPRASAEALGRLALRHANDPFFVSGLLSSLNRDNIDTVLTQTLSDSRGNVPEVLISRLLTAAVLLKERPRLGYRLFDRDATRQQSGRSHGGPACGSPRSGSARPLGQDVRPGQEEGTPEIRSEMGKMDAMLADARATTPRRERPDACGSRPSR